MQGSSFKILIIGDPNTGKTSFIERYVNRRWQPQYKSTIGAQYHQKTVYPSDSEQLKLHLWDIAGQDQFKLMSRAYYQGAHGCLIFFDVSNGMTMESCVQWKADLDAKVVQNDGKPVPCVLVANKSDLLSQSTIDESDIKKFVKSNGFEIWSLVSVKDNSNVEEPVNNLVDALLKVRDTLPPSIGTRNLGNHTNGSPFVITEEFTGKQQRCC